MTQEEITEGNKLIAEFRNGILFHPRDNKNIIAYRGVESVGSFTIEAAKYHSSWDWLMPVVDKISTINLKQYEDDFIPQELWIYGLFTPIEMVYEAVVEFIKWYNKNGK